MAYFQTDNLWVNKLAEGVADLVLDIPGGRHNFLNRQVLLDLVQALERVAAEESFRVLLLRSAKGPSFCSGLAPQVLAELTPSQFAEIARQGQELCERWANLRVPSVAIIAGACLGGGLELALACDYRVAVLKPSTVLGFPDLESGLIPMWGGTQRLPQVVGLERGLQMLLGGRRVLPAEAKTWGLVDEVSAPTDPTPPAFLNQLQKRGRRKLPLRTFRQKLTESTRLGRWLILRGAERLLRRRLPDDMPAPWIALEAVRTGLREGRQAGLARERSGIEALAATQAARNLIFLHIERDQLRLSAAPKEGSPRIRTIGVVGAGSKGSALIYMAITKGCQVVVRESSDAALGYALFRMLTLFQHEVTRGSMAPADMMKNLGNIRGTTAWKGFEECDLILEAIGEDADKKLALFAQMEKQTRPSTLLVTTGSATSVTSLQEKVNKPERVGGLHFLPPLGRSLLVEVVSSPKTSTEVSRRLTEFVGTLGRTPHSVNDLPGFLVHRLLVPYFNEAVLLIKEGFSPQRIDEAMVRFGMNNGPLEHLDLMGLDTAAPLFAALQPVLGRRLVLDEAIRFMVEQQWLGQKTELGFYRYRGKRQKVHDALVARLQSAGRAEGVFKAEAFARADQMARIRRRLVFLMLNEAAWCLEEGRADSPDALDLALMLAGWAPHRGGPFRYASHLGIPKVLQELEALAAEHGPRYKLCPRWTRNG